MTSFDSARKAKTNSVHRNISCESDLLPGSGGFAVDFIGKRSKAPDNQKRQANSIVGRKSGQGKARATARLLSSVEEKLGWASADSGDRNEVAYMGLLESFQP